MSVEFAVLGDVVARIDGRRVQLGHPRQQCVLMGLLLDAGRVVPLSRLAERVWGQHPPDRPRQALYSYLSRLRTALSHEQAQISRRAGGYVLTLGSTVTVDLLQFRHLAAKARAIGDEEQAIALFEQSLALWRGDAFATLDTPWLNELRDALHQERLAAVLDCNDLRLRQGQHSGLLPELFMHAEDSALNERLAGQLMLALYRGGRVGDALRHFERTRRALTEDLGLDPSPELQRLHQQILAADPVLSQGSGIEFVSTSLLRPVPRQLPLPPPSLAGRAAELAAMTLAHDRPDRGSCIVAISGPRGVGKSALALWWARQNLARFPDGQLYFDLGKFDSDTGPLRPQVVLRTFLSALGVDQKGLPLDFEAQLGLYRSLSEGKRILIVLDNVRNVDQVRPVLPGSPSCSVLITSRVPLRDLATAEGAIPLALAPLAPDEARQLLALRLGSCRTSAEPEAVDDIITFCGRLPLALAEAASYAAHSPELPLARLVATFYGGEGTKRDLLDTLDTGDPNTYLKACFDASYRALSHPAARLFGFLGLVPGPDISLSAAARLAGLTNIFTRELLCTLADVQLVQHAEGRWRLDDVVRPYAAKRGMLDLSVQLHACALQRLIGFYASTMETAGRLLDSETTMGLCDSTDSHRPSQQSRGMAWFTIERPCLLALQQLAFNQGWHWDAWRLALASDVFYKRSSHVHDHVASWQVGHAATMLMGDPTAQGVASERLAKAARRAGVDSNPLDFIRLTLLPHDLWVNSCVV